MKLNNLWTIVDDSGIITLLMHESYTLRVPNTHV